MKFFSIEKIMGRRKVLFCLSVPTSVSPVILVALLLVGFTSEGSNRVQQRQQEEEVMRVKTVEVVSSRLLQDLNSFGTISYSKKNDVTIQVEGVLQHLLVKEGDKVARGQILARLENIQLEIQGQQGKTLSILPWRGWKPATR